MTRIHGIEQVPMAENESSSDLLRQALRKLFASPSPIEDRSKVRYLIYCHTIQTVAPYPINLVNQIRREFELVNAIPLSLTMQNCASSITALDLADTLLSQSDDPEDTIIILTGEKAFTPTVQLIPNTTIMGEASAACLVSRSQGRNQLRSVKQKTLGQFSNGVRLTPQVLREFDEAYVPTLSAVIQEAVSAADMTMEEIDWILPHNINLSSWRKVSRFLEFPREKIFLENVSKMGHCFCSDVFVNYESAYSKDLIKKGSKIVLVSVGLGATFAAAVIEH